MAEGTTLLAAATIRNLSDKLYEKRKAAALEVEQVLRSLGAMGDDMRVRAVLDYLVKEFAHSPQTNMRKGGLIGLAAAAVALMGQAEAYLPRIVPPVLAALGDPDSRVRYYACEALYNIAKVAREDFVPFFAPCFDALCKLCADADASVQNAAHLLDRLVKDIVCESAHFAVADFVPLLSERLSVPNPHVRSLLMSWVAVIDSHPGLSLAPHLPDFLGGLMALLADGAKEIRTQTEALLSDLLVQVTAPGARDVGRLLPVLVAASASPDDPVRAVAAAWIHALVTGTPGAAALASHAPELLASSLSHLSQGEDRIRRLAGDVSDALLALLDAPSGGGESTTGVAPVPASPPPPGTADGAAAESDDAGDTEGAGSPVPAPPVITTVGGMDVAAMMAVARAALSPGAKEHARVTALAWVARLVDRARPQLAASAGELTPALLESLADPSPAAATQAVDVLASLAGRGSSTAARRVLSAVLSKFKASPGLLDTRGPLILRRLASSLGAECAFTDAAGALTEERDGAFAAAAARALHLLLLTSPEAASLRAHMAGPSAGSLLLSLFPAWCACPISAIGLCLAGRAYGAAWSLVRAVGSSPLDVDILLQVDTLVTLLESAPLTTARLHLLEPRKHPALHLALYGLLMILPQSPAWKLLERRLASVPTTALLALAADPVASAALGGGGDGTGEDAEPPAPDTRDKGDAAEGGGTEDGDAAAARKAAKKAAKRAVAATPVAKALDLDAALVEIYHRVQRARAAAQSGN